MNADRAPVEHSPAVAAAIRAARARIREASAEIHKREADRVAPVRAALAAERTDTEEAT